MMRLCFLTVIAICCMGWIGCDMPEQKRPVATPGGIDIDTGGTPATSQNEAGAGSTNPQTAETQPPPPAEGRKQAEVGDGRKGHYKEQFGRMSVFDRTIGTMYRMQEKMDFMLVTKAVDMYKAEHGHVPKTHEEFMEKIIKANAPRLNLPELKEGCRYEYNPEKEVLEVVYPLD